jgi:hypothetical protein
MRLARLVSACVAAAIGATACRNDGETLRVQVSSAPDSTHVADSIPDERPDSVRTAPPDSATMLLAMLPPAPGTPLDDDATAMADRAVFVPRTQRWFMAMVVDSVLAIDVGRIDGGVGGTEAARATFALMVASRSPVQRGMPFTVHRATGPTAAHVTDFGISGRRIVALLDLTSPDSIEHAVPAEFRGQPPMPLRKPTGEPCRVGDSVAIATAVARFPAEPKKTAVSVLRGCFGDYRAVIAIRPLEISPDSVERVVLVRANGTTRSGKLRDLSYPLHELRSVLDIDGDGVHEIVVRSFRMSMHTWAALRMTDSVTFTRFASGFTVENR